MNKIKQWAEKIDALSLRERGAILFCSLIVIYFVWDSILMQPLRLTEKRSAQQLQQSRGEVEKLNAQIENIVSTGKHDPNKENKSRLQALKTELTGIEQQLRETASALIPPQEMALMLETVLVKIKGLQLQKVHGLGSQPVVNTAAVDTGVSPEPASANANKPEGLIDNAYKHGLRIEFQGDYLSTLEYIRELENLEWGFFWESLDLKVNDYPNSSIGITVYTLSLDKNWIGV
ncbi:MAG: hypothetical protein GKR93_16915 [Gammaproteobacteria bacterium]|nr:hypothetical protein [Gammaproteobacteria bacterium]